MFCLLCLLVVFDVGLLVLLFGFVLFWVCWFRVGCFCLICLVLFGVLCFNCFGLGCLSLLGVFVLFVFVDLDC